VEAEDEIRLHAVPGEGAARIGRIGRRTLGRVGTLGRAALGGAGERRERLQHGPPRCHARLLLAAELRLGRVVVRALVVDPLTGTDQHRRAPSPTRRGRAERVWWSTSTSWV